MEPILITIVAATIGSVIGYYLFIKYNEEELKNETTERLTRIQKKFLASKGYDPNEYAFAGVTEQTVCFMNKETGKIKEFEREE